MGYSWRAPKLRCNRFTDASRIANNNAPTDSEHIRRIRCRIDSMTPTGDQHFSPDTRFFQSIAPDAPGPDVPVRETGVCLSTIQNAPGAVHTQEFADIRI